MKFSILNDINIIIERIYSFIQGKEKSEGQESSDFSFQSKYLIQIRGLPWSVTKQEIMDFFAGVNILNGINGIHFIIEDKKIRKGEAYVQLTTEDDLKLAQSYHKRFMGERYIEGMVSIMQISNDSHN